MYIFQFTLPLTLNLIIMINTTPPLPTFFFLSPKKKQGFCKRHSWHMPSISFACGSLTFERVFEPWGGVNEEELGLVLRYHLVILLDGLSEHVLRKLVLGADTNNFKVTHKQLQGHTETKVTQKQPYSCNGVEWSKDRTQAAESIKWRPQQAYFSNQVLLAQPQTVFSTPKILTFTHR